MDHKRIPFSSWHENCQEKWEMENSEGKLALQSRDLKIETPTKHWNRMYIFKKFLVWEPFLFFSRLSFQMFLCFFLSGCAGSLLLDTGFL